MRLRKTDTALGAILLAPLARIALDRAGRQPQGARPAAEVIVNACRAAWSGRIQRFARTTDEKPRFTT